MLNVLVKKMENDLLTRFPKEEDVLITLPVAKMEKNIIITDCSVYYNKFFPIVGKKKVYQILDFHRDGLRIKAVVILLGYLQVQQVFSEKQKIVFVKKDNPKSEKRTIITAFFNKDYCEKFMPQRNFLKEFSAHNKSWDVAMQNLFEVKFDLLKDLIAVKEFPNMEFKV